MESTASRLSAQIVEALSRAIRGTDEGASSQEPVLHGAPTECAFERGLILCAGAQSCSALQPAKG
jgi:hypothetical protein